MPFITAPMICDVSGRPDNTEWSATIPVILREGSNNSIVTQRVRHFRPVDGVLTMKLEPGPTSITYGDTTWIVTVPENNARLWDLIATAIAVPPNVSETLLRSAVEGYLQLNPLSAAWDAIEDKPLVIASGETPSEALEAIGAGATGSAVFTADTPQDARNAIGAVSTSDISEFADSVVTAIAGKTDPAQVSVAVAAAMIPSAVTYSAGLPATETIPLATGGNLVKTYHYDATGKPTSCDWNFPTGTDFVETFTYDASGNATGSTFA